MNLAYPLFYFAVFFCNTIAISYNKNSLHFCKTNIDKYILYTNPDLLDQCIVTSKNDNMYCNNEADDYIKKNDFLTDKKLITISPGGYKGFYLLGILAFIKKQYPLELDNYIYSGASAGSWNSLFMCYKGGDVLDFAYKLLDSNVQKSTSITETQYYLKYNILTNYKDEDFDLKRLFIGVTTFEKFTPSINIYSDFTNVEDAINCCIASSHIPFITGGITNKYHNTYSFDGGFSIYPYLKKEQRVLHVSHNMWENMHTKSKKKMIKNSIETLKHYSDFFSISKNNLLELFDSGYNDAKKNKDYLDKVFLERNVEIKDE